MFVASIILILMISNSVFSQTNCNDDVQCSDGSFCEKSTYTCRGCMDCSELHRNPLAKLDEQTCVKSDDDCGPCLKNYTTSQWNSKCVLHEEEHIPNITIIAWFVCAAIGLLIVHFGIFLHIIFHKYEYEFVIVRNYAPIKQPLPLQLSLRKYPIMLKSTQEIIV